MWASLRAPVLLGKVNTVALKMLKFFFCEVEYKLVIVVINK